MPAPVVLIAAFGGFGLVIAAVAGLNGGAPIDFSGLFPAHGRSDWPQGVQEDDVPHFAVDHVDALRLAGRAGGPSIHELSSPEAPIPRVELVAANVHRLGATR